MNQPTNFNPNKPFTVREQPHQGKLRTWACDNADDFVSRCCEYYMHSISWQEFEAQYELTNENGEYAGSSLSGNDWDEVRRYIADDMQYCVLVNN